MTGQHFKLISCVSDAVEAVEAETDRAFGRHVHEHFGIGLISHGAQQSASGRGRVEAMAGDVITVNPGEVHDGIPIGGGTRRWRMLYFDPKWVSATLEDMAESAGSPASEFAFPVIRDTRAASAFRSLYLAMTGNGHTERLAVDETLLVLLDHLLERKNPAARSSCPRISRAQTMIDDDPLASLSLSMLAKETELSRFQLVRAFARQTGLTPHAYLLQRRIHLARRLIAGGTPLAEAAAASGFADQSHMTRLFVRNFGFSPGAYAKKGH